MGFCDEHTKLISDVGEIKANIVNIANSITRLDKRINGTFTTIGEHIKESPEYRADIKALKTEVQCMKEERLNTTKNSQWRVSLISAIGASTMSTILTIIALIIAWSKVPR